MKSILLAAPAALLVLGQSALALPATPAGEGWVADYDEAMRIAKETGKDVLVDFTGSDWCGWCIRLDNEVFSQDAFKEAAPRDYVLCALDFPRGEEAKAKVPNPTRNAEIRDKFEIRGYPTILVLTNEGELLAETGYRQGGAESYLAHLTEIRTMGREALTKVNELVQLFETAEGDARIAVVGRAIDAYQELSEAAPARGLVPLIEKGMDLDPKNERGLKLRAVRTLLEAGSASDRVVTAAEELDPKNEEGLLELCVQHAMRNVMDDEGARACLARLEKLVAGGTFKDRARVAEMCAIGAQWYAMFLDDMDAARPLARKALELGVEDEEVRATLESILESGTEEEAPARG